MVRGVQLDALVVRIKHTIKLTATGVHGFGHLILVHACRFHCLGQLPSEAEVREILRVAAAEAAPPVQKLGTRIAARFANIGLASELPELHG